MEVGPKFVDSKGFIGRLLGVLTSITLVRVFFQKSRGPKLLVSITRSIPTNKRLIQKKLGVIDEVATVNRWPILSICAAFLGTDAMGATSGVRRHPGACWREPRDDFRDSGSIAIGTIISRAGA